MQVRLLGPVDVVVGGVPRPVSGSRRKAVLAALALEPGEVMSTDRLIHVVWGDAPPATAGNTLQSHISHLRRVLGDRTAILGRPPGYVLNTAEEATDVQVAERLIRQGTQSTDPWQGEARLKAAVGLWRGRSLVDVTDLAWFHDHAQRLDHLLLRARQALIEFRMTLGQHSQLVPELEGLRRQNPLHEQLHGLLILALYRAGRQADAVAAYQELRRTLDEELGIEPSQALHELHAAVLRQDPALDAAPVPAAAGPAPAQLPPAITVFTGRGGELAQLDDLLPDSGARPGAVVISAVSGTAGVGKTALAVHWARRVQETFPDGQLYVNLRGFDSGGLVTSPAQAVRGFLDAFGVPPAKIPSSLEAQTGLYRSLLAGRRVLVVLDNARDAEQVRPLLPGAPGCLALVTSRNRLTSLAAAEGARLLTVDLLTPAQGRELLTSRLDAHRAAAEPEAVDAIAAHCAGLPLALAIVAARAAEEPHLPLAALAAELAEAENRLDTLDGGDPATQVRAVLSWSYRTLHAAAARLFRLLGLHPGPDVALPALAALAGVPASEVRKPLVELVRAHLLAEHVPGRYTCHDLLRVYATELAHSEETETDRRAATHRLLDHYVHTARTADVLLTPQPNPIALPAAQHGAAPETLADDREALAWFTAEHRVLLAAVEQAAAGGFDSHAWQLSATLTTFLDRQAHWRPLADVQSTALAAALRQEDPTGQANAHRGLGLANDRLGRTESARAHYQLALDLFSALDNHPGQARTHQHLARMCSAHRRYRQARDHARHSLEHYRAVHDQAGQSAALNHLGWCCTQLGDHHQALAHCRQALALALEIGDLNGEAHIRDSLGYIHHHLGQHGQAVDAYRQAVDLFHQSGDRHSEAAGLVTLGEAHHAADNPVAARAAWTRALIIVDELGLSDTDPLRATIVDHLDQDRSAVTLGR